MKVFLHIGMPKCASSSIQGHFANHSDTYAARGALYPVAAREVNGYRSHRPLHTTPFAALPDLVAEIAKEARQKACTSILLSSEAFIAPRFAHPGNGRIINVLQNRFGVENVEILFVVREHASFVRSSFSQFIRAGLFVDEDPFFAKPTPSINAFVDTFRETHGFDFFEFSRFHQLFEAASRHAKINVINLSDRSGPSLLERVCALLGTRSVNEDGRLNQSLSTQQLFCLLFAQKKYGLAEMRPKRRLLINGLPKHASFRSPLFDINAEIGDRIAHAAAADRVFFAARADLDLPGVIPDDTVVEGADGPTEPSTEMMTYIDRVMAMKGDKVSEAKEIAKSVFP